MGPFPVVVVPSAISRSSSSNPTATVWSDRTHFYLFSVSVPLCHLSEVSQAYLGETYPITAYFGDCDRSFLPLYQHSRRLISDLLRSQHANAPIDLEIREQGRTWLLPPYNYSIRRIADNKGYPLLYIAFQPVAPCHEIQGESIKVLSCVILYIIFCINMLCLVCLLQFLSLLFV